MRKILLTAILLMLMGCATSSAIVTGQRRVPIHPDMVTIYSQYPDKYEEIAIINAKAEDGWTEDHKVRLALEALKKRAAKLGANGVVITGQGIEKGPTQMNTIGNSFVFSANSSQVITGRAIFVPK